ncbi:MAG: FGGY family carbohydrate kinase [Aigarchaeota archaeon]|nr:FGGY family carbohydrate kinase [Candidatus Calditenuaceae archaeon]
MSVKSYDDSEPLIIGLDLGTSSAKACLFDSFGKILWETSTSYEVLRPYPGWREQDAEWWWQATIHLLRELAEQSKLSGKILKGLSITHQRLTFVPVNEQMHPIYNAILWNDIRCSAEVEYAKQTIGENEIYRKTGVAPGYWSIYKILWLKNNFPDIYERTYKFLLLSDYVCFKLTKRLVTTQSAAILTGALDIHSLREWCIDLILALGLSEEKLVEDIMPSGSIIGEVSEEVSYATSLPKGIPVITAAGDQPCGALGAGLTREGQVAVNGGTSCTSEIISETIPRLDNPRSYYLEIAPTGKYVLETTIPSGGSDLMRWFKENFGASLVEEARKVGEDVWSYIYNQAKNSAPGSKGVILVPYFNSAGPPYWDLNTGGIIIGLTTDVKYYDIVRAIIEGLAFEVKRDIRLLEEGARVKIDEILMYGGSSRSDVWNQIFSDVVGSRIRVPETPETTALGAAICAAVGSGIYNSWEEAVKNMVKMKQCYLPDINNNRIYEKLFEECYLTIYDRVRENIMKAISLVR